MPHSQTKTSATEQADIQALFARVFSHPDAPKVMDYLKKITTQRTVYGSDFKTNELWHLEGQRSIVLKIENYINQGKKGRKI
jgi:hypothetical protein